MFSHIAQLNLAAQGNNTLQLDARLEYYRRKALELIAERGEIGGMELSRAFSGQVNLAKIMDKEIKSGTVIVRYVGRRRFFSLSDNAKTT